MGGRRGKRENEREGWGGIKVGLEERTRKRRGRNRKWA